MNSGGTLTTNMPSVPARQEMRRLPHVGAAWIDMVVRSDRNVDRSAVVAIQVTDEEIAGPVGSREPAFKCTGDARAELPEGLVRELLLRRA